MKCFAGFHLRRFHKLSPRMSNQAGKIILTAGHFTWCLGFNENLGFWTVKVWFSLRFSLLFAGRMWCYRMWTFKEFCSLRNRRQPKWQGISFVFLLCQSFVVCEYTCLISWSTPRKLWWGSAALSHRSCFLRTRVVCHSPYLFKAWAKIRWFTSDQTIKSIPHPGTVCVAIWEGPQLNSWC